MHHPGSSDSDISLSVIIGHEFDLPPVLRPMNERRYICQAAVGASTGP